MKSLVLFLCSIATSPQCYQTPDTIEVKYESNQVCAKVAQQSAAALIGSDLTTWLIGYACDGIITAPPDFKPKIIPPDDGTTG